MTTPSYSNDQDSIARYVLGDMTVEEQIAFEALMAGNVELARATIAASAIDDLLRRAAHQTGGAESRIAPPNSNDTDRLHGGHLGVPEQSNNRGISGGEDCGIGRTGRSSASNVIGRFLPGWGARGGRPRGIASRFRVRRRGQFGKVDRRPIRTITIGTQVFAADGRFHPVTDVSSHPYTSPELIRIETRGDTTTALASDNHPFLLWRDEPTWVRADAIQIGDFTMTPAMPAGRHDPFPKDGTVQVQHDGQLWQLRRVESVERVPYQGDVWNLSVDTCPSFQTAVGMSQRHLLSPICQQHQPGQPPETFS